MEQKGDQLIEEGEKSLKKFSFFTSNDDKVDRARDKFIQAATQYKACGNYSKAAAAFTRAADMSRKAKNDINTVVDLEEGAKCSVKAGDTRTAAEMFTQVVDFYDRDNKPINAAKTCISLSEVTEGKAAMGWLERASQYYRLQGSKVTANDVVLKMADVKARSGDYEGACVVYDQLAREALDDRVSRGGARKLFFTALLARLASFTSDTIFEDVDSLRDRFAEYQELDTQFNEFTREHMLIKALIEAIEEENVEKMGDAVMEYDNICPLDGMREKMLLRAKAALRKRVENLR